MSQCLQASCLLAKKIIIIIITGASNVGGVCTNRDRRRYSWLSIDDVLDL